jgi:hypothetical protein
MLAQRIQIMGPPIIRNGLVGHWFCQTNNGKDYSGNSYDLTLNNNPTFNQTITDPTCVLNGINQDAVLASTETFDFERTDSFSLCAAIKIGTTSADTIYSIIAKMSSSAPYRGYNLMVWSNNTGQLNLSFYLISTWNTSALQIDQPPNSLATGITHRLCLTTNGSGVSGITLHDNGVSVPFSTTTNNNLTTTIKNSVAFRVGSRNGVLYCPMSISDCRVYNRALSSDEAIAITTRNG